MKPGLLIMGGDSTSVHSMGLQGRQFYSPRSLIIMTGCKSIPISIVSHFSEQEKC